MRLSLLHHLLQFRARGFKAFGDRVWNSRFVVVRCYVLSVLQVFRHVRV